MKLNLKNVLFSVGIFVFAFVMFTGKADAAAITAAQTGAWADTATWTGGVVPVAGDTVTIPTGMTVTVGATAAAASVDVTGTLAVGAFTLTTTTGVTVQSGGVLTIATGGGTLISPTTSIIGTATNNGTLTVSTALSGAGSLTNSATGTLNIGFATAPTITTLTATATGNVVNYTAAAPNCKVTTYDTLGFTGSGAVTCAVTTVTDEIILSGTVTWTTTSSITTAILTIGSGTSMTNAAAYTLTPASLAVTSTGALTNAGTVAIASIATSTGSIVNSGTMTITTFGGTLTALTNTGTLNLAGTGAAAANITTLTAGSAGTINYSTGAQTIHAGPYYNLAVAGTGIKTFPASLVINNNLTINGGGTATVTLVDNLATAYNLYFGTTLQGAGKWGAVGTTGANYVSDTYFTSGVNHYITVTDSSSSTGPTITTTGGSTTSTVAQSPVPVAIQITPEITETTMSPGCSGGNKYNTSTGELCQNTVVAEAKVTYNFGNKTLKNGSRGEAVMELQRFLNATLNLGLVVDGKLGPKTIKVIKQWQKEHDLVADGLIGAKTKAKMNAEAN
ncbi:MAG: peptidoglycan-binding domain-containing protein [Candidatus Pacebacteria bacterium]|nr:peptidoglycan-binding domain-containing protein [Candidatus Paceibacterota bacterium]